MMQSAFFVCLSLAAVRENQAIKMGDCYRAGTGAFEHSGFNNSLAYVFNGVRNTCIVAVLKSAAYTPFLCSGSSRPSIGVEDDNVQALADTLNNSNISQLWGKRWYVKMNVGDVMKSSCWIWDSSKFTTSEYFYADCAGIRPFICQYEFNYDCAYHLASSSESNITRFFFPSDYRYSKGQETSLQNGGCFYTLPTIDKSNKNPTFTSCSATCATGNGTPPIRFAASNGSVEIFTCNTNVSCEPAVSSATGIDTDLLIAVIVLVFAIVCLSAVVFFVCYKQKQKKQKKTTFRRRINSKISFTTENQPTSTMDTLQDDPLNQSRITDSLKSIRGNGMPETNRGFIKTSRELGAKDSAKKKTKKLPVKVL